MKDLLYNSIFQGVRRTFALLVWMLFVFVFVVSPIKVKAEAFPIPPLWLPMNPYNAQGLESNYVLLNDDQKKIVKEVLGAVNTVYLGFGGYALQMPITGIQATRQFYQEYGNTFLNTFWSQIMGTSRAMTDFVGSTIYKASTYDTYEEYEQDTAPSLLAENHKYFQISPELTVAFKNWYRANGGVEDWQVQTKPFETTLTYPTIVPSGTLQNEYNYYYSLLQYKIVRFHNTGTYYKYHYNSVYSAQWFGVYNNLFYNTTTHKYGFYDDNGNTLPYGQRYDLSYLEYQKQYVNDPLNVAHSTYTDYFYYPATVSDYSNYNTYVEIIKNIYNGNYAPTSNSKYFMQDFVKKVYVGADWSSKQEIYNVENLNIGESDSEYIHNIDDVGYVDINTLIGQIADEVVNLREVVEESVLVKDGDTAIPYADSLQVAIDKFINQPESGVVIPVDIFGGLTGVNGPVSYLWFMTKPLVSYTGDLLGILTLDGDGTFQFTGLGYIVVGVVTVGIIGGLVTKCLL